MGFAGDLLSTETTVVEAVLLLAFCFFLALNTEEMESSPLLLAGDAFFATCWGRGASWSEEGEGFFFRPLERRLLFRLSL